MTGFEFAKTFDTMEEKMLVLFLDAVKTACNMAGIDFDSMSDEEKMNMAYGLMKQSERAKARHREPKNTI